jgi:signal transduction histidine kinase
VRIAALLLLPLLLFGGLADVRIAVWDEKGRPLPVAKKPDFYNTAYMILKPRKPYTIAIDFFRRPPAGTYYLIITGIPHIPGCYEVRSSVVCPIDYDGKSDLATISIAPLQKPAPIRGMMVVDEEGFFAFLSRQNRIYFLAAILIGFIAAIILYSLMLFASLKERLYLFYALMEGGFLAYALVRIIPELSINARLVWSINALALAGLFVFTAQFLRPLPKWCAYLLYGGLAYALLSAIAFAAGVFHPFLGSLFVPIALLCALTKRHRTDVRYYIAALLVIAVGVVVIEFFGEWWRGRIHPMFVILPLEAVLMLFAIAQRLKAIRKQTEELRDLLIHYHKERSLSRIVASITHRLKTDLSRLSFCAMELEFGSEQPSVVAERLHSHINELKESINGYLALYQNNLSKAEPMPLKKLFETVIKGIGRDDVRFELDIPADLVTTRPWAIKEIAIIAIDNALEAFKAKNIQTPTIRITARNGRCTICDNAGGITPLPDLQRPVPTQKSGGSGIGLYIAATIARHHLGSVLELQNTKEGLCLSFGIR